MLAMAVNASRQTFGYGSIPQTHVFHNEELGISVTMKYDHITDEWDLIAITEPVGEAQIKADQFLLS